jgi:hypothetical protein
MVRPLPSTWLDTRIPEVEWTLVVDQKTDFALKIFDLP